MQTNHAHREGGDISYVQSKIVCFQSKTHNELIFPFLPFYTVRGDIDIHTSQQALCQFPSLIQICSEWSANPSALLAARMIARPVWRENYNSNTPGDLFSFCVMSLHKTSWSNFIQMKYFPPSLFFVVVVLCSMYGLSRLCCLTHVHELTWECLHGKRTHIEAHSQYTFSGDPITILDPATLTFTLSATPKLNLYPSWTNF